MAPHGRGWGHYVFGLVLNGLFFALLGPPIGAAVLVGSGGLLAVPALVVVVGQAAYWLGAVPAFVAGVLIAIVGTLVRSGPKLVWIAAIIGGASAVVLTGYGHFPQLPQNFPGGGGLPLGVAGAIAAAACATMAERWGLLMRAQDAPQSSTNSPS